MNSDNKKFRYQLHTHTYPCSHCAKFKPEEVIADLLTSGYAGCVLTNHFLMGNTGIDPDLPWEEFVRHYEDDYLACKELAKEHDLDILFGVEEEVGGGLEVLLYGLVPEQLYAHPELRKAGLEVWYEALHPEGVLCIQAHPFRKRGSIPVPGVLPLEYIDGIEVYNAGNEEIHNSLAREFADRHPQLILTSGADAHAYGDISRGGIETDRRIKTEKDLAATLKQGDYRIL